MDSWTVKPLQRLPDTPPPEHQLRLFDTAQQRIVPVGPPAASQGDSVGMYVCGITPYDSTHMGHTATYVVYDLIQRVWRDMGHRVRYIQNVTDVDDPLLERAQRDGEDWRDLAQRQTALFTEDMQALNIIPPDRYVSVTESIESIVSLVQKLLDVGAAYTLEDGTRDVYFDYTASKHFGYESHASEASMRELFAERGGDPEREGKRHPLDALLWRGQREGEPHWSSPLGPGRPGWHVECSAIATEYLGEAFTLQGGGSDLTFPHHEYSAAHAEVANDYHPFAEHYVHAGMVMCEGEKISKSLGNLVFSSQLRRHGVDPAAIRLALLDGHYRSDREWTAELLRRSQKRLHLWRAAAEVGGDTRTLVAELRESLARDLDTPTALEAVDAWSEQVLESEGGRAYTPYLEMISVYDILDTLLGVQLREPHTSREQEISS